MDLSKEITIRNLSERDIYIIKPLLEKELKKIKKLASNERQHFGSGYAFDELESYIGLMVEDFNAVLELPEFKEEFKKRMERIKR